MAEAIIQDWLTDYENIQSFELRSFAAQHENNYEISSALFSILNERHKYPDLLYPVCNQFYGFYKSNEIELRRFTLQFIPILIYLYLNSISQGDKKSCRCIETLLISIYNIEISNDDGQPKVVSFRMPVLAQASIYHEEKNLHPTDLKRWEEHSNKDVKWGPLPQVESLNASNRLKVLTAILFAYNQQLSLIHKPALYHLCRVSSQIVNQGFSKLGHAHRSSYGNDPNSSIVSKPLPRIPISSKFLLELLNATYFAMFNEFASVAIQTVDDIHNRACYEMFSDVVLVTNAVKNSLHANPSGQPSDGPMGISVALTPATTTVTISKSMITNASFRTKKLPDDIPIQGPKDDNTNPGQLVSITEESEADQNLGNRGTAIRSSKDNPKLHKVPFPGFKKLKDKEKDKEKDKKSDLLNNKNNNTNNNTTSSNDILLNKRQIGKDKFASRNSLQMIIQGSGDGGEIDKLNLIKPKSNSIDTSISTPEISSHQQSNGGGSGGLGIDEKITSTTTNTTESFNTSIDTTDSIDSSIDMSVDINRPSITVDVKSHGTIQVSQV